MHLLHYKQHCQRGCLSLVHLFNITLAPGQPTSANPFFCIRTYLQRLSARPSWRPMQPHRLGLSYSSSIMKSISTNGSCSTLLKIQLSLVILDFQFRDQT